MPAARALMKMMMNDDCDGRLAAAFGVGDAGDCDGRLAAAFGLGDAGLAAAELALQQHRIVIMRW